MALDLGCGSRCEPGWDGIDFCYGPDTTDFEHDQLPYPDSSIDRVRAIHSLEHISHTRLRYVFAEVYRVLAEDGEFLVEVPDLNYICQRWLSDPSDYMLYCIYGDQGAMNGQQPKGRTHKTGFNDLRLIECFALTGFRDITCESVYKDKYGINVLIATGRK